MVEAAGGMPCLRHISLALLHGRFSPMPLCQYDTRLVIDMIALTGDALQTQLPEDFERCADALRNMPPDGDIALQRRTLHELRGLALAVGADRLASLCEGTEQHAQSAVLFSHLAQICTDIARSIRALPLVAQ
jgi:hypothetical protein